VTLPRFADLDGLLVAIDEGAGRIASAPGLAAFAGPGFLVACIHAAAQDRPGHATEIVIDAGVDTGRALEAVRLGAADVALDKDAPGRSRATALIEASGARLHLL